LLFNTELKSQEIELSTNISGWDYNYFGRSISISDNYAFVGSNNAVIVFEQINKSWYQRAELFPHEV